MYSVISSSFYVRFCSCFIVSFFVLFYFCPCHSFQFGIYSLISSSFYVRFCFPFDISFFSLFYKHASRFIPLLVNIQFFLRMHYLAFIIYHPFGFLLTPSSSYTFLVILFKHFEPRVATQGLGYR